CTMALISYNPITLRCPNAPKKANITWEYLDISWPNAKATGSKLLSGGDLKIRYPTVENTGIYECKVDQKTLAGYEVDFQDANSLHVSHADLGQETLKNVSVRLGEETQAEMFTAWSHWQACDRCGSRGERKKVGFCYQLVRKGSRVVQPPLPCGLMRVKMKDLSVQRGPEIRYELCDVSCTLTPPHRPSRDGEVPILVLATYKIRLHADAIFNCPTASIYSPVYWQRGSTPLTHLDLAQTDTSYSLDKATGGTAFSVRFVTAADAGDYWCYVDSRLTGKFQLQVLDP
uniref:Ig-like domain-containing protein n=1 Tax=Latimeria chalumnae TaxID=7897 RepID=H3A3M0_LATCH